LQFLSVIIPLAVLRKDDQTLGFILYLATVRLLQHVAHHANDMLVQVAERIRPAVDRYQAAFPALLEIPSKEHPYGKLVGTGVAIQAIYLAALACIADSFSADPSKDSVLKRVQKLRGD